MFQFHNGSIKRVGLGVDKLARMMFQFHNGSIKSVIGLDRGRGFDRCFNSTMVRLKDEVYPVTVSSQTSFNSTMVRLKVERRN